MVGNGPFHVHSWTFGYNVLGNSVKLGNYSLLTNDFEVHSCTNSNPNVSISYYYGHVIVNG